MRTVLRYEVPVDDRPHEIAAGAVLMTHEDRMAGRLVNGALAVLGTSRIEVWVDCFAPEDRLPEQTMRVQVFGTGQPLPANARWLGSCVSGRRVWHLYELAEVENGQGYKGFEET